MKIQDQITIRMQEMNMTPNALAACAGVTAQSVRFWMMGRSRPGPSRTALVENALNCKLDFSEGLNTHTNTVEDGLRQTDVETFLAITKLPDSLKQVFSMLVQEIVLFSDQLQTPAAYLQPNPLANTRGYATQTMTVNPTVTSGPAVAANPAPVVHPVANTRGYVTKPSGQVIRPGVKVRPTSR